ncbi:hypothetical protein [Nonomuraea roseoviolacea]|uniref:Uncharacterized protein n=1 Tax=Nonomuraea roseoviolacea subsp. carminata TaxID=160689 RepID=A0ABT1KD43_9ACTN|nr:hypothetical protein [Nonomuraea roseoviolacea]MCP2351932.1 hypothetical protein [Nonomuraea roseoviolacea subsp. carminata]
MNLRITPPAATRENQRPQAGKQPRHHPRPVLPRSPRGTKGR